MVHALLRRVQQKLELESVIDLGCGPGLLSPMLSSLGLDYVGIDTREENVAEALRRYPDKMFRNQDVVTDDPAKLGSYDITFCFGLLYHIEDLILALRNMHSITKKVMIVETELVPLDYPGTILSDRVGTEGSIAGATGFTASVPSLSGLIYMLYHVGFPFVYLPSAQPDHTYFRESALRHQKRIVALASREELDIEGLILQPKPDMAGNQIIDKQTILARIIRAVGPFGPFAIRRVLRKKI